MLLKITVNPTYITSATGEQGIISKELYGHNYAVAFNTSGDVRATIDSIATEIGHFPQVINKAITSQAQAFGWVCR